VKPGWEIKPLGEVCTLQRGFDLPKRLRTEGKYPLVTSSGVSDTHIEAKVKGPGVATGRSGSIGEVYFIEDDFWPLNTALYVKDFHGNCPRYVWYLLQFFDLSRFASGAGVPTLNRNHVHGELVNSVNDFEEQKRIVAVLDAAFEGLTRAKENAETNLQNARELFENAELELFFNHTGDIPETRLGDYADFRNGLNFSKNSSGQTVKIVGVGDFQDHFWMPLETLKSVSIAGDLSEQDMILEGDILAVRSNGNKELIGRVMLADSVEEPTSFSGFTIRIRLKSKAISPEFVCYFMKTKALRKLLAAGGDGANISNLNQQLLGNLALRVPSQDVQELVIAEANKLRTAFNDLTANYQSKLTDIEDLRQSLLQKAFAGELT